MKGINLMLDWYTPVATRRWFLDGGFGWDEKAVSIQFRILGLGIALTLVNDASL